MKRGKPELLLKASMQNSEEQFYKVKKLNMEFKLDTRNWQGKKGSSSIHNNTFVSMDPIGKILLGKK